MINLVSKFISGFKTYAIAILGGLAAVFGFLWQMTRAKHEKALRKGAEAARKTEKKATGAMVEGLDNESKIQADNSVNRSKFLD